MIWGPPDLGSVPHLNFYGWFDVSWAVIPSISHLKRSLLEAPEWEMAGKLKAGAGISALERKRILIKAVL